MSRQVTRCAALLLLAVFLTVTGASAREKSAGPQYPTRRDEEAQAQAEREKEMAKARVKDRYTNLKRDSEKLLQMATELKQYVDKAGEGVLSVEVIRKCEQIEKLSRSVREKMRGE